MLRSRGQGQWLLLLAATAIALFLTWRMYQPFLSVLIWAGVLVLLFYPLHRRFVRATKKPSLAAALSILVVLATVIVPLGLVGSAVAGEMAGAAGRVQAAVRPYLEQGPESGRVHEFQEWLQERFHVDMSVSSDKISQLVSSVSQTLVKGTISVVGGLLGAVLRMFLVLFTMYYFFRDGDKLAKALPDVLPVSRREAKQVISRTIDIIRASVNGSIVIAVVQGGLGGITFAILGLPSALVWGVVMTIMALVPVAGPAIVWGPAAVYLGLTHAWAKAIVLVVIGAGVIGTIDNLLRPRLVGQRARMHELTVFFTVLGGIQLFGMLGFLVGPVLFAVTIALLQIVRSGPEVEEEDMMLTGMRPIPAASATEAKDS
jgi:predicted PurR-regulated permease PerM